MDEDFPRGPAVGSKVRVKDKVRHAAKQATKRPAMLFQEPEVDTPKAKKTKKTKADAGNLEELKEEVASDMKFEATFEAKPHPLTRYTITEGMLVLATVKEVHDYEIVLSLPNGLTAFVQITDISAFLTQKLQETSKEEPDEESLPDISDLYEVGDLVPCKIKDVGLSRDGNLRIQATLNYAEINSDWTISMVKPGMTLRGCVSSIEDHGYSVDFGIRGTKAFLANQDAKSLGSARRDGIQVGHLVSCVVKAVKAKGRSIILTSDPVLVRKARATSSVHTSLATLLPGTKVNGEITQVLPDRVLVDVLGMYKGCVGPLHLLDTADDPTSYNVGQKVKAVIIYNCPTKKCLGLSLNAAHLKSTTDPKGDLFSDVSAGDIIDEATVVRMHKSLGIVVQLTAETRGIVYGHRTVAQNPGDKVRCRIVNFNHFDRLAILATRKSVLEKLFLGINDIKPGMLIKGVVETIKSNGVGVKIQDCLHGFIPRTHLADIPIQNPQDRFIIGTELELRVLLVKPSKRRIVLTHKKTLVKSTLPLLTSYTEPRVGMWVHACVVSVKDFGCIVSFYNDMKGIIPRSELGMSVENSPAENFFIGQVVKCRVHRTFDPKTEKLSLSLRKESTGEKPEVFVAGKITKVEISKVTTGGLAVSLLPNKQPAFIPRMHLSDYASNCEALMRSYSPGDVIDQAMTWSYIAKTRTLIITCKPLLIAASRDGSEIVREFAHVRTGMLLVGVMRHAMSYGIFVEFPNNIVGLAPTPMISDEFVTDPTQLYTVGQTLRARVKEVDAEKRRFLVSLRSSDVDEGSGLEQLEAYFQERDKAVIGLRERKEYKELLSYSTGSVVQATVRSSQGKGLVCALPHDVNAVIGEHHIEGENRPKVGEMIEACVLNVDLSNKALQLSAEHRIMEECKKCAKGKCKKFKKEKDAVGLVLLVKEDFILALVSGQFIYLPAKKQLNSIKSEMDGPSVGEVVRLRETREVDGRILATYEESKKAHRKTNLAAQLPIDASHPLIGQVVNAVVKAVKASQVYVTVEDGTRGRIHASEVSDNLRPGQSPLKAFTVGQNVRARVVGHQHTPMNLGLPISHAHHVISRLELSVKQSALEAKDPPKQPPDAEDKLRSFQLGQTVTCVVNKLLRDTLWVQVSWAVTGMVHRLNLSKDPSSLVDPKTLTQPGTVHRAKVVRMDKDGPLELSMTGDTSMELTSGSIHNCKVLRTTENRAIVQLPFGHRGSVFLTDLDDCYVESPLKRLLPYHFYRCCILETDEVGRTAVSLRPSRVKAHATAPAPAPAPADSDRDIQTLDDITKGQILGGYIKHISPKGVFVSLSRLITGRILAFNLSSFYVTDVSAAFPVGKLITTKVLRVDKKSKQVELSSSSTATGQEDPVPEEFRQTRQCRVKETREPSTKNKGRRLRDDGNDSGLGEADALSDTEPEIITTSKKSTTEAPHLQLPSDFSWDESAVEPASAGKATASSRSSVAGAEEEEETVKESPRKKSKKERAADEKTEEEYLYKTERALMDAEKTPETPDEFERLVASSPNSSLAWIRYMAFHLQSVDVEKARAVAERALNTINFREEQEKLNVWVAFLNLENLYGTEEELVAVFQRALQQCEPIKVFQQLVGIYVRTNKLEQAEQLHQTMIKRFKADLNVWIGFGTFLMRNGRHQQARRLMQRSFNSLVQKDHVAIIAKFAQLEFRHAEPARGKTMFENVLSNYPKRTDIWSIYLDMTIKLGDVEATRHLFERVIHLNLSAKKIKFFFKRFLDFEKQHGDESTVTAVKQKAVEYVESKTGGMSDL